MVTQDSTCNHSTHTLVAATYMVKLDSTTQLYATHAVLSTNQYAITHAYTTIHGM